MAVQARGQAGAEERVTPLELFFDLIFVFAITQVTGLIADDPTWAGLVKGVRRARGPSGGPGRRTPGSRTRSTRRKERCGSRCSPAMGAMLIASLAVPDVFGDGRLHLRPARTAFVRIAHLVLVRESPGAVTATCKAAIARLAVGSRHRRRALPVRRCCTSTAPHPRSRSGCLALSPSPPRRPYARPAARAGAFSRGHFAERHGLIVIIALGETIVALGLAASHEVDAGRGGGRARSASRSPAALWWLYFDVVAIVAERKRHQLTRARRPSLRWPATPTAISTCR